MSSILNGPMPLVAAKPSSSPRRSAAGWGFALTASLLAFALTHVTPSRADNASLLLPFAAVLLSGWLVGWQGAATSTILLSLLVVLFTLPGQGLGVLTDTDNAVRLGAFLALSGVVIVYQALVQRAAARVGARDVLVRTVVQSAPVLITGTDEQGRIVLFNEACERLTGLRERDVFGQPFVQTLVPMHAREVVIERFSVGDQETLARPHTNPWAAPEGERLIEWRCFRLPNPQGAGTFVLGVGQDVTERRAAEEALRRAIQIQESLRAEAEAGRQVMQRSLATVSHEMRGPLTVLLGRFRMLELQSADRAVHAAMQPLHRNAALLKKLADDLVEFSRISEGKLRLNVQPVLPTQFLASFVASARTLARERDIVVEEEIEPGLPAISADPERLQQVLLNLLTNALKFSPCGGKVRLAAHREGGSVRISITDSGDGIPPEHLRRMFEPFWQGPTTTSEKQGLGVGLAVVKELVTRHGGTVTASESESGGLTVSVLLPVAQESEVVSAR